MALMAMSGALCYSELAIRFPQSGGEFVYLRAGYGEQIAFLYGWMIPRDVPGRCSGVGSGLRGLCGASLPLGSRALAVVPAFSSCVHLRL